MKKHGIIIANWKMNFTLNDLPVYFKDFQLPNPCDHKVFFAPQAPLILEVKKYTDKLSLGVGAQNCSSETQGAFTGEINASLLHSLGTNIIILGHSERRQYFHEQEELLAKKIHQVINTPMQVIYCVGETLQQREQNQVEQILSNQLKAIEPFKLNNAWSQLVIAYEPVWAIGTGKVATLEQVQEVHGFLLKTFKNIYPGAPLPPILYGGSVNSQNAQSLFALPDVSGFLVGGASLKPKEFSLICSVQ